MATSGGVWSRWKSASRPIQVLVVILVVAGVALASGVVLSTIQKTQTIQDVPIFLDANCNGANEGNEVFAGQAMGAPVVFCLGVTNAAGSDLTVHTHLSASCPATGVATISDGPGAGDDLAGPDGQLPCTTEVAGPSKLVTTGSTATWSFSVIYTVAVGDYVWTFSAAQG